MERLLKKRSCVEEIRFAADLRQKPFFTPPPDLCMEVISDHRLVIHHQNLNIDL